MEMTVFQTNLVKLDGLLSAVDGQYLVRAFHVSCLEKDYSPASSWPTFPSRQGRFLTSVGWFSLCISLFFNPNYKISLP